MADKHRSLCRVWQPGSTQQITTDTHPVCRTDRTVSHLHRRACRIGQFDQAVKKFLDQNNGKGLNVTVPFKEDAWSCATQRSDRAQRAGAVNTLIVKPDGELFGDTTDGTGLVRDLVQNHNIQIRDKDILLIGAGGAYAVYWKRYCNNGHHHC